MTSTSAGGLEGEWGEDTNKEVMRHFDHFHARVYLHVPLVRFMHMAFQHQDGLVG